MTFRTFLRVRRRAAGVAVAAVVAAGIGALAHRELAPEPAAATRAQQMLSVTTTMPGWRAPGAPIVIRGFSGAHVRLTLRANGKPVAAAVSGARGRYELRFAAAQPGRYRLVVGSADRRKPLGTLVVRRLVIDAVGDITFGEQVGAAIARYGAAYPWTYVARTLRAADITIGNLETAVTTGGTPAAAKKYVFRGEPSALRPLSGNAGFDVLTLANNHSVDYGRDALLDTVRAVRAAGMQPIGAGLDAARARRPAIVVAGGLRVAFLGYSDVNPLGFPAEASAPGTARADVAAITADVQAARRRADVVACFFHWGTELQPAPDSRQETFASACLNAGAKLVLGAHPHVFGPVARPSPSTLVAWSLGNFVFPSSGDTARTAILTVELDRRGVHGYRLLPVQIDGFTPRLVLP